MFKINELFESYQKGILENNRLTADKCNDILRNNHLIIYGAGNTGTVLFKRFRNLGISVESFWDENGSIYGKVYQGIPILDSSEINATLNFDKPYVVIVTLLDILSYDYIKSYIFSRWGGTKGGLRYIILRNFVNSQICFQ